MKLIDISINVQEGMVIWPGDPEVKIEWAARIGEKSDANISALSFGLHTGTHIDVPLHFVENGWSTDALDLNVLNGVCEVVEIPERCDLITRDVIRDFSPAFYDRILFKTRNSHLWSDGRKEFNKSFVALDPFGAEYLVEKGCKLVGIDYLSIAPYSDPPTTHKKLLSCGVVILEGLDLSNVKGGRYELHCLPLKLAGREGAPARAVLEEMGN